MAHEIDSTTGKAGMAYKGAAPWHNLGQRLDADATMDDWKTAAGLDWKCQRAPVYFDYNDSGEQKPFTGKDVLFRSDTHAPLAVVSSGYHIAQPAQVLDFFAAIAKNKNFEMETAGSLFEGRRIWALARVGENARILDDVVAPYLMLATSYDATMSTIAQFTSVRVVCNNTLQGSLRNGSGKGRVTVPHSAIFRPEEISAELGLATTSWDQFITKATRMAVRKISDTEMDKYLLALLDPEDVAAPEKTQKSKGYKRIMALFHGEQMGTGQDAVDGTVWGALQATTQYIDWEVGRNLDNRLDAAWFGTGARVKTQAALILDHIASA